MSKTHLIAACLCLTWATACADDPVQPTDPTNNDPNNAPNNEPNNTPNNDPNNTPEPTCDAQLDVLTIPDDSPLASFFDRSVTIHGFQIVATPDVSEDKLLHAAALAGEYLDNNEDCLPDDPDVAAALARNKTVLPMGASFDTFDDNGFFETDLPDQFGMAAVLGANETRPEGRFDAALEEVIHVIQVFGYAAVYPDEVGFDGDTALTRAMDLARGGHFESIPDPYPAEAWYHYDDETCDYPCMAVEYFYWALTTHLGAQSGRCDDIDVEWELCTPEALETGDPAIHAILTNPDLHLPTRLPDGDYTPSAP